MSSTTNRTFMPIIDFEQIPVRDMLPPQTSKQNISFLQLPREVRDPIYHHSIVAGNLAILRLNKVVREEASQLLAKHAALRINLGFANRTNWSELRSASVTPLVQYVDLRIKGTSDAIPFDITVISGLLGKQVVRESCIVTLNYGKGEGPDDSIWKTLYRRLARLDGFKKVVFKIVMDRYELADFRAVMSEESFHEIFHYDTHLLGFHEHSYMDLQQFMQPLLGPAVYDDSLEGHCLQFHPLEPFPEGFYPRDPWLEEDEDDEGDEDDEEGENDQDDEEGENDQDDGDDEYDD